MSALPIPSASTAAPLCDSDAAIADLRVDHWIDPLSDGTYILIRPLEAMDRDREFAFIKNLSPESRHFRFLATMKEPGAPLLDQLMDIDYQQRMAYVALYMDDGVLTEIGVARYAALDGDSQCESAVVVADQWQRKGLGRQLMKHLIAAARLNGFTHMMSMDSAINVHMRRLAHTLGFDSQEDPLDATQVVFRLKLT
jgi:GNAT superfamily N-acetyltransferase